jgi:hypothetical protein
MFGYGGCDANVLLIAVAMSVVGAIGLAVKNS